jgi:hypothetical protein
VYSLGKVAHRGRRLFWRRAGCQLFLVMGWRRIGVMLDRMHLTPPEGVCGMVVVPRCGDPAKFAVMGLVMCLFSVRAVCQLFLVMGWRRIGVMLDRMRLALPRC